MTTMIRFEPMSMFKEFNSDVASLLGAMNGRAQAGHWYPPVDVEDAADAYVLHLDVPGLTRDDIELELDKGVLTIKGERKLADRTTEKRYAVSERETGRFVRRFRLPESSGAEVSAKLVHGVLEVRVSKPAKPKPVRIEVAS